MNTLLCDLLANAKQILSADFIGMYLTGSLAIGDFDDDSDIDFIIVIHQRPSQAQLLALQDMHIRLHAIDTKWATCLEGYYIPQLELQHYNPETAWHLYLDNGSCDLVEVTDNQKNWVFERYILQTHGITLAGPPPQSLIAPVSAQDLRQALLPELHNWADELLSDPRLLTNRWRQSFVVLSLCRMLYSLQYGTVISKIAAAEWAKTTLDPRWKNLIERAWAERPNPPLKARMQAEPQDVEATPGFIRYILDLSRQYEHPLT